MDGPDDIMDRVSVPDGGGTATDGGTDGPTDIDDVFEELEELAEMVDDEDEREQVLETMRTLRKSRSSRMVGRLQDTFDSRDVGEALVGSFLFGVPMMVEDGTREIGAVIAQSLPRFAATILLGFTIVYGILHAVEFERIEADKILGVLPIRLVSIPLVAGVTSVALLTLWGRVDWAEPAVAAGQCTVTALVMAVGASLGDVLPGT
jgi:uncharacterized membrane protein